MPITNAERQRRYRDRALKDPDGLLLTRLQIMLSPQADGALRRIVETTGKSKREVVEMALLQLEKDVTLYVFGNSILITDDEKGVFTVDTFGGQKNRRRWSTST